MHDQTDDEDSEEKRLATDDIPLAAIFKTRRAGRRRASVHAGDRSVAEANARRVPDSVPMEPAGPAYDVVLTDAFAVGHEGGAHRGAPVIEEADEGLVAVLAAPMEVSGAIGVAEEDLEPLILEDEDVIPFELISTADDLRSLRDILPPNADLAWAQDAVLALAARDAGRFRTPSRGAWFADLFSEEFLVSQPERSDAAVTREVAFLKEQLGISTGADLLDLACGTGRHARAFAREGCQVTAVDLSLPLLRRGVEANRREADEVRFMHCDMRDLVFDSAFDAAWMLDTSFGYFTDIENLLVLRSVWRALRPGGRLLIDVINREHVTGELPTRNWWEGEACLVQEDIEFSHVSSRLEIRRYLVFADGRERAFDISVRLFSVHELRQMLQHAGFVVLSVSGSVHTAGAFFGPGSERILITAQRPGPKSPVNPPKKPM